MKRKLKVVQIIGLIIMGLIVMRAELLHIIQVNDLHFIEVYNVAFFMSLILIFIYPVYIGYKKHLLNPLNWIRNIKNILKSYINK